MPPVSHTNPPSGPGLSWGDLGASSTQNKVFEMGILRGVSGARRTRTTLRFQNRSTAYGQTSANFGLPGERNDNDLGTRIGRRSAQSLYRPVGRRPDTRLAARLVSIGGRAADALARGDIEALLARRLVDFVLQTARSLKDLSGRAFWAVQVRAGCASHALCLQPSGDLSYIAWLNSVSGTRAVQLLGMQGCFLPSAGQLGPKVANLSEIGFGPNVPRIGAQHRHSWPGISTELGRKSTNVGQIRPLVGQHWGTTSSKLSVTHTSLGITDFGQVWPLSRPNFARHRPTSTTLGAKSTNLRPDLGQVCPDDDQPWPNFGQRQKAKSVARTPPPGLALTPARLGCPPAPSDGAPAIASGHAWQIGTFRSTHTCLLNSAPGGPGPKFVEKWCKRQGALLARSPNLPSTAPGDGCGGFA